MSLGVNDCDFRKGHQRVAITFYSSGIYAQLVSSCIVALALFLAEASHGAEKEEKNWATGHSFFFQIRESEVNKTLLNQIALSANPFRSVNGAMGLKTSFLYITNEDETEVIQGRELANFIWTETVTEFYRYNIFNLALGHQWTTVNIANGEKTKNDSFAGELYIERWFSSRRFNTAFVSSFALAPFSHPYTDSYSLSMLRLGVQTCDKLPYYILLVGGIASEEKALDEKGFNWEAQKLGGYLKLQKFLDNDKIMDGGKLQTSALLTAGKEFHRDDYDSSWNYKDGLFISFEWQVGLY